jgi:hypothetical protein
VHEGNKEYHRSGFARWTEARNTITIIMVGQRKIQFLK